MNIFIVIVIMLLAINSFCYAETVKTKEFKLVAKETKWELLPGVEINAWAYNGRSPSTQGKDSM